MADNIRYQVTRRGTRYGVHVDNMTKAEASQMLEVVVAVKCVHENGAMTKLQSEDILNSVECPTSLDPSPAAELWATRIIIAMFAFAVAAWSVHDIVREWFK